MSIFHKKKRTDQVLEDGAVLKRICRTADVLKEMLGGQSLPLAEKLDRLIEQVKYASPSAKAEVAAHDGRILDKLDDLKIAFTKLKFTQEHAKAEAVLDDIAVLLKERELKMI